MSTAVVGLVVLALAGVAVAGVAAPWRGSVGSLPEPLPDRLEDRRTALLLALKDLEDARAAGALEDIEYERLRVDTESRIARLLRVVDERAHDATADDETRAASLATDPRRSRVRWTGAIGGIAAVLAVSVPVLVASVGERGGFAFTGDLTGNDATTSSDPLAFFRDRVARNPDDVAARLDLAHRYLDANRPQEAIDQYLAAVRLDPDNAEANAHLGLLLHFSGRPGRGLRLVERALDVDPRYPEALFFKGLILLKGLDQPGPAVDALAAYLEAAPYGSERATARRLLDEARRADSN